MDETDIQLIENAIEALLFASSEPMSFREIDSRMPEGAKTREALESLTVRYADRGINLKRVGESYAFRTSPSVESYLRKEVVSERKLSRAAIETLAIIAYHQPSTRSEIEEIRGVAVSKGTLDQLLALEWIKLGARRETPGRPITFLTTVGFLDHFGLASSKDLPGINELREAGLLERSPLEDNEEEEAVNVDGPDVSDIDQLNYFDDEEIIDEDDI